MPKKRLIVVGGPTASGKTEAAIALARHFDTDVIGADARQIYAELAIGVGRPSAEQLATVPHHMIGHVSIHTPYSAGRYLQEVLPLLAGLFKEKDHVILAGGTGLYIQAVTEGLDEIPAVPPALTDTWTRIGREEGLDALQQALANLDPGYYEIVDRQNPVRMIRAITVSLHTGKPYSSFRKGRATPRPFEVVRILLDLPRETLYQRIDQRVLAMLDAGWLQEARALYPYRTLKALQTVGYQELFAYLDGQANFPDTVQAIQQSTRRYAKRQLTWFRHHGIWTSHRPGQWSDMIRQVESASDM